MDLISPGAAVLLAQESIARLRPLRSQANNGTTRYECRRRSFIGAQAPPFRPALPVGWLLLFLPRCCSLIATSRLSRHSFDMHVAGLLGALVAATAVTAAPSPKLPYFRGTRPRPTVQNFVSNVASAQYNLTDIPGKPTTKAPHSNIWATLSNDEAAEVVSFLHNQTALNLTAASDAGSWDNQITVIDLAVPNKTVSRRASLRESQDLTRLPQETLKYLSGKGPKPPRMAYATIMFNSVDEPYVEDYLVGPLPVSANTTYHPYSFRTTKGTSKVRNYDADSDATYKFMVDAAKTCDDIVEDLLGAPTDSCASLHPSPPDFDGTDASFVAGDIWGIGCSLLFELARCASR